MNCFIVKIVLLLVNNVGNQHNNKTILQLFSPLAVRQSKLIKWHFINLLCLTYTFNPHQSFDRKYQIINPSITAQLKKSPQSKRVLTPLQKN